MSTDTPPLAIETQAGIQIWRMQLAPVNALHPSLLAALHAALDAAERDDSLAAVVLASGLRVFSAGGDAAWMGAILAEGGKAGLIEEFNRTMNEFRRLCVRIRRSPLLVVAALGGHTLAGGLELAAACDLRFCAADPRLQIGVPEMNLFGALPSGGGGAQFLARLLGPARALEFILEGQPVAPEAALAMGLVERLCPPGEAEARAADFAAAVARKAGRIGTGAAKRAIFGGHDLPFDAAMDLDQSIHWDAMRRGNFLPGVEGFIARFGGAK